ncbi:hypothetical protein V500_06417 [Pseudogymnoascus sp. VKM F-4518 (FW-2643)]|nr:hypothetical protein V500_06417 [Pseudogymnoascus sp. VKM F-4518 (FW-2643)]
MASRQAKRNFRNAGRQRLAPKHQGMRPRGITKEQPRYPLRSERLEEIQSRQERTVSNGRNIEPKQRAAYLTKNTPDVETAGKGVGAGKGNGRVACVDANPGGGGGRGVVFLRRISSWPDVRSE